MGGKFDHEIHIPIMAEYPMWVAEDIVPTRPKLEYLVLERWSDGTIRHPTTGVVVSEWFWVQNPKRALHILRTEGR